MSNAIHEKVVDYEQATKIFSLPDKFKSQKFILRLVPVKYEPFESEEQVLDWSEEMSQEWWKNEAI